MYAYSAASAAFHTQFDFPDSLITSTACKRLLCAMKYQQHVLLVLPPQGVTHQAFVQLDDTDEEEGEEDLQMLARHRASREEAAAAGGAFGGAFSTRLFFH